MFPDFLDYSGRSVGTFAVSPVPAHVRADSTHAKEEQMLRTTLIVALVTVSSSAATFAAAVSFKQTNLVSDGSAPAVSTDSNLINPWGLAQGPGPFWIANQGTNTSTLYDGAGTPQPAGSPLVVNIPQTRAAPP